MPIIQKFSNENLNELLINAGWLVDSGAISEKHVISSHKYPTNSLGKFTTGLCQSQMCILDIWLPRWK